MADAHVQGGMVGDLSLMCPEFVQVRGFMGGAGIFSLILKKEKELVFEEIFFFLLQSFLAGLAASGAIISALRLITKAAFENSKGGLRKGARMNYLILNSISFFLPSSVLPDDIMILFLQINRPARRINPGKRSCFKLEYIDKKSTGLAFFGGTLFFRCILRRIHLLASVVDSMIPAHPLTSFSACQLLFFDLLLVGHRSDDILISFLQINRPARHLNPVEKIMFKLVHIHKKSTGLAFF